MGLVAVKPKIVEAKTQGGKMMIRRFNKMFLKIIANVLLLLNILSVGLTNPATNEFIDRMRNLKGKIPYRLMQLSSNKWGWNDTACMYSIGIAVVGTPFEGQYNVDQAMEIGESLKLLRDPAFYKPHPGDIAIVPTSHYPSGGHAVMITENGGTIQNGASHNGIWESHVSPQEMFGKVNCYISMQTFLKRKNVF